MVYHSRQLVAQTLSKRGGSLEEDIFAIKSGGDDLALNGSILVSK